MLAHPEPASYTAALARAAAEELEAEGWSTVLDDLAAEGFRADAGWHDVLEEPSGALQVMAAQERAAAVGGFAPDVAREIDRLLACDLLVVVFPLWWSGPPALLKGWFDRVLACGVAYGDDPHAAGPLRGKRALAVVATGAPAEDFAPAGGHGALADLLAPILDGTFGYCAMEVLRPFAVHAADGPDDAVREEGLRALRERLRGIAAEAPLPLGPHRPR